MTKPAVKVQGHAVIERIADGECLLMLPTGEVLHAQDEADAEKKLTRWCRSNMDRDKINVTVVTKQ